MFTSSGLCRASLGVALAAGIALAPGLPAIAGERDSRLLTQYADALGGANAGLTAPARRELAERVLLLTSYYRIDPRLLLALVTVESSWRAGAVSPVGALGLGQLMPGTASTLGVDPLEPYENLDGTARYLRRALNRYAASDAQTRVRLAVASYNAGPGAVARYHGVPPYRETQAYVENVMRRWRRLAAVLALPGSAEVGTLAFARTAPHERHTPHASRGPNARKLAHAGTVHRASHRGPKHVVVASVRPARSPYLDADDPNSVPLETPPPVHYERSRSAFARLLGLRHRVDVSATPTPQTQTQ
jgi:hypothetical protein